MALARGRTRGCTHVAIGLPGNSFDSHSRGVEPAGLCCTGLKISTQIFDASRSGGDTRGQLISSSLTLCHNGRVYDYVSSADELVIYDPVQKQFTVLNRTRGLFTVVTFEEIRHHMETRTQKTQEYLAELISRGARAQKPKRMRSTRRCVRISAKPGTRCGRPTDDGVGVADLSR
ncbi:MAG UNVERIFIED_CONTAM: hypothetical protein LVR18_11625 [Planctomycetaceae bacterium]